MTLVLAGCGVVDDRSAPQVPTVAAAAPGTIDPDARTYRPTSGCTYVRAPRATSSAQEIAPPIPEVSANIHGWKIEVRWHFLDLPSKCHPRAVIVTTNSVDKLDNMAFSAGAGGPVRVDGEQGRLTLDAPFLDLPPYEARVSVLDEHDIRSLVTTVPVVGSKPACTDRSVARCIAQAEAFFQRCLVGSAPRRRCHPKAWRTRPPLPVAPLRGLTRRALEVALRATIDRMRSAQAAPTGVSCSELPDCQVTWETVGRPTTRFVIRYRMSGHETNGSSGCWIATRYVIVDQPADPTALRTLEAWGNAFTQPSGCTS